MTTLLKNAALATLMIGLLVPAVRIYADETPQQQQFAKDHPRRAEVNARVRKQRQALRRQLKAGKITQQQYNDQMATLKNVKNQEHADVAANGGHLTKDQDGALNQQLDQNRQVIKQDNQAAPPPPAQ